MNDYPTESTPDDGEYIYCYMIATWLTLAVITILQEIDWIELVLCYATLLRIILTSYFQVADHCVLGFSMIVGKRCGSQSASTHDVVAKAWIKVKSIG